VRVRVQVLEAMPLFVTAVVVAYYNRSATKQQCTVCKPSVKFLENGQWHESSVYGLQNNMCHFVTVQSGLEALN
jgi:hypothetical protein